MNKIEQQQLEVVDEQLEALSKRRNFLKEIMQFVGVSGVALVAMRIGGANAATLPHGHEPISVKDFGAVGDGLADDTTAIQAAIDASNSVYLSAGVYKCTAALVLAKSNFKMYGDGELHFENDFLGGGLTISAHVANINLEGFTIKLLRNVHGLGFCGVFSNPTTASVTNSKFSNLKIYGAAFGINIDGRKMAGAIPSGKSGKTLEASSKNDGNLISGNVIKDSLFPKRIGSGGAHGIYARSGYNIITNNHIENMQGGILAASEGEVTNNVLLNCFGDNGIYCAGGIGLSVQGNIIENTKADGIAFNHAVNCSAMGNKISGAGNASFRIQASHNIVISGNACNSKGVSGSYVRSFIDSGSPDASYNIVIENNHFGGGVSKSNPFAFGSVPLGSAYKNWRIIGNHVVGVDTSALSGAFFGPYAIVLFGSNGGNSNLVVEGNTFSNVAPCPKAAGECRFIRNATRVAGNVIEYARR